MRVKTVIGYPAPTLMNTGAAHGAALGAEEVAATKKILGFDPEVMFPVEEKVINHTRGLVQRGAQAHAEWQKLFDEWAAANPANKELLDRVTVRGLPDGWADEMPTWELDNDNDKWLGAIREHGMGAIMNGISLHGGTRVYGGTFLIFSEYLYPSIRVAALSGIDGYYVFTHDSIGLGEDGPTHQPVETLTALRAIPDLAVIRPADANETSAAWKAAIEGREQPKILALSRQNLPVLEGTKEKAFDGLSKGAYVLVEESKPTPDVILMASGSEVQLAVEAAKTLEAEGTATRVVSMPCMEWFLEQDSSYIDEILPPEVTARVSVEAAIAMPWFRFTGDKGRNVSLEHFGASAPGEELFTRFGITTDAVVNAARESLASVRD